MTPEEINVVNLNSRANEQRETIFTFDCTNSVESGNLEWIFRRGKRIVLKGKKKANNF